MRPAPPWLVEHLKAAGLWNADSVSRTVRATLCRTCRALVLTGLDSDTAGVPAVCDPQPLTPTGEAVALLGDRPTYTLTRTGRHTHQIDYRDQFRIRGHPAGTVDVVPAHACGAPPLPAADTSHGTAARPPPAPDEPPF